MKKTISKKIITTGGKQEKILCDIYGNETYYEDGTILRMTNYDSKHRISHIRETRTGLKTIYDEFKYNSEGKVLSCIKTLIRGSKYTYENVKYKYNNDGNLISKIEGELETRFAYNSDNKVRIIQNIDHGKVVSFTKFIRDEFGNVVNKLKYNGDKQLLSRTTYIRSYINSDYNIIQKIEDYAMYSYKYNANGDLVSIKGEGDTKYNKAIKYEYYCAKDIINRREYEKECTEYAL